MGSASGSLVSSICVVPENSDGLAQTNGVPAGCTILECDGTRSKPAESPSGASGARWRCAISLGGTQVTLGAEDHGAQQPGTEGVEALACGVDCR